MAAGERILVGSALVDFSTLTIDGPAGSTSIEPKIMNLLQVLVNNAGTVVTRAELLDQVWGETYGGDESLSRGISLLRRAFGDTRGGRQYIETVPKRGYRLTANINTPENEADLAGTVAAKTPNGQAKWALANLKFWCYATALVVVVGVVGFAVIQTRPAVDENALVDGLDSNALDKQKTNKSLAVLPFNDLSGENDQQYLADGIAEEILNALVKFPELRIIGRTSSFGYRKQNPDLNDIRSTLGVAHVLSGSVRKQGERVRVTVSLTETSGGQTVWADSYDGELDDLFDLQTNIARKTAASLGGVLNLSTEEQLANKLTDNKQAYVLFVQGRSMARKFGHSSRLRSKRLLEQAIDIDPDFAAAWAWLAQTELYLTLTAAAADVPKHIESAQRAADQSIKLQPDLAMGHYVYSMLYEYNLDFARSTDAMENAFNLTPDRPFFAVRRGFSFAALGLAEQGIQQMEQGLELDPTDAIGLFNLGVAWLSSGQTARATELIERSLDLGFEPAGIQLCSMLLENGGRDAAASCWLQLPNSVKARFGPVLSTQEHWSLLVDAIVSQEPAVQNAASDLVDQHYALENSKPSVYPLFAYLFIAKPEKFMSTYVDRPFAFNAAAISNLWSDNSVNKLLRQHPEFPKFADRIGLVRAWQKYGWPDQCAKSPGTDGSAGQFTCR